MKSEIKICQNCKKDFIIEEEDFNFYEKIKVPPPTFCPDCRTVRRLCWRNEMSLFKRKCDAGGHDESVITIYNPEEKLVVYDVKSWWGDKWNASCLWAGIRFFKTVFPDNGKSCATISSFNAFQIQKLRTAIIAMLPKRAGIAICLPVLGT